MQNHNNQPTNNQIEALENALVNEAWQERVAFADMESALLADMAACREMEWVNQQNQDLSYAEVSGRGEAARIVALNKESV